MAAIPSDEDDMPEEVTLNEGREEAKQSRRNETENSKRLAAELKEKRKSRSEKKRKEESADKPDENGEETTGLAVKEKSRKRKGRRGDGEEVEGKHDVGPAMLDESVVQLLRAREKQAKAVGEAKHKYIEEEPQPEPKAKKSSKLDYDLPTNSRTQIVSLKAKPNSAAADSALEFRRSHFYGSQVKRSVSMLPTSKRPHLASV